MKDDKQEAPHPKPASKVELAEMARDRIEAALRSEIRTLAVCSLKLQQAREHRGASAETVSDAAQAYRAQQRKVASLTEEVVVKHIDLMMARAEEVVVKENPTT